jgi:hypothetical protein
MSLISGELPIEDDSSSLSYVDEDDEVFLKETELGQNRL